jgi:hypothetical protein
MADFIPTGRTSLVKRGDVSLQVQTEYAVRPTPRITTTVQKSGQVIQKIERNLESPIADLEEKNRMEVTIRKQHAEVVAIIKENGKLVSPMPLPAAERPKEKLPPPSPPKPYPEPGPQAPLLERLQGLPGKFRLFHLDNQGNFADADLTKEFRRKFKAVFKNLGELIAIFSTLPGVGFTRETGVYEIERDKLYLISSGLQLHIMYLEHPDCSVEYERAIGDILANK